MCYQYASTFDFVRIFIVLGSKEDIHIILDDFEFCPIPLLIADLAALECLVTYKRDIYHLFIGTNNSQCESLRNVKFVAQQN